MNRTYYITLEQGKIDLPDLKVEITINDPDEYDYTIESIDYNGKDFTDLYSKRSKISVEIERLIDNCISEDESLTAEYNQFLIDRKEDMDFRTFHEG